MVSSFNWTSNRGLIPTHLRRKGKVSTNLPDVHDMPTLCSNSQINKVANIMGSNKVEFLVIITTNCDKNDYNTSIVPIQLCQ